jgi:hypothetical protein
MTDVLELSQSAANYLREEADFNRSWCDGRRGTRFDSPERRARRLELAVEREAWANAIEALIKSTAGNEDSRA